MASEQDQKNAPVINPKKNQAQNSKPPSTLPIIFQSCQAGEVDQEGSDLGEKIVAGCGEDEGWW